MKFGFSIIVALLALTPVLAPAQEAAPGGNYVPGEVLVVLRDSPAGSVQALSADVTAANWRQATLQRLEKRFGVATGEPVFGRVHLLTTDRSVSTLCRELSADPGVEFAQPNYIYHICRDPNDPDFADQYAHQLIEMAKAWDITTGSRDIVIAALGTGVDVNHPDLKDNIWINKGEIPNNGLDDDKNGYVDDVYGWNFEQNNNAVTPAGSYSVSNHETQVAGVIGAVGNNGKGVVGVNWKCSIMVLRVSLSITTKEVAAGLDYAAANGARVVNMSFGGDDFGPEGDRIVKAAVDHAYAKGVLLVASAGNADSSRPNYPAAYYNVMAVSSTNGEDTKTGHSTFGPWVDIAAPGTDIVTTDLGNKYISTAGTSFSSPYVAAVAALVLSYRPDLTNVQVRAILENTTDPIYYGDLDPNLCYIGTGRVNAYQALLNADVAYPLGEVVAPAPRQTYPADGNALDLCIFVHGDSYRLDYRLFGATDWTALAQGTSPTDPNGLVHVALANPGVGTYELRLCVTTGAYTHTERAVFGVELAPEHAPWPIPKTVDENTVEFFIGNPLCLDLNGDGRNEIIQGSIDYGAYADLADLLGYSYGFGKVNIWTADGNSLPHWPVLIGGVPTSFAVGDIDGDGDYEVIVACETDGELDAYHIESGLPVAGEWPVYLEDWNSWIAAPPVLADLDGDGISEIVIAADMESASTDGLFALRGDGTYLWQRRYITGGPISVADINKDGKPEIALCGYGPGLTTYYTFLLDSQGQQIARWKGGSLKGPAFGDLNNDGKIELVFCTDVDVEAVRADGSTVWKAKAPTSLDPRGGLCLADLNGDGFSEVYVNSYTEGDGFIYSQIYGFDYKGKPLTGAGFPKTMMGDATRCTPLVADIDGDGQKELLVGCAAEPMMAWKADGSVTPGFPTLNLNPDIEITPTLADYDGDGKLEILLAADDYRFHVLDLPGAAAADQTDWAMARHDPQNSAWTTAIPRLDPIAGPTEIKPGQRLQVQITAANPANLPLHWSVGNLPEGAYYDAETRTLFWKPASDQVFNTYLFSFLVSDGIRQSSRGLSVTVLPNAIYSASMDTDPNWTLDPGWAWGSPTGQGSWNSDPNGAGHTGENVIGYALDGDYADNLATTGYATTGPIDCRGYKNIRLSFWRWLGVEAPYDYACLQVSTDGKTWTDLWTTGVSHISDDTWQLMEYAVPAGLADNQATVYFRWGLGPTDDFVTAPGWNIDDVQVTGDKTTN